MKVNEISDVFRDTLATKGAEWQWISQWAYTACPPRPRREKLYTPRDFFFDLFLSSGTNGLISIVVENRTELRKAPVLKAVVKPSMRPKFKLAYFDHGLGGSCCLPDIRAGSTCDVLTSVDCD